MNGLRLFISGFTGAAGRFGGLAGQVLQDRLELLALELREAKIRFIQALLLAYMGVAVTLLGLLLLILAGVYAMAPEWRVYGLAAVAMVCLISGAVFFLLLRRRLAKKPPAFAQSLAELKKDMACFSTKT